MQCQSFSASRHALQVSLCSSHQAMWPRPALLICCSMVQGIASAKNAPRECACACQQAVKRGEATYCDLHFTYLYFIFTPERLRNVEVTCFFRYWRAIYIVDTDMLINTWLGNFGDSTSFTGFWTIFSATKCLKLQTLQVH